MDSVAAERMLGRQGTRLWSGRASASFRTGLGLAALAFASSGCVGIIYSANALAAASKLEEARTLGAAELAEYEYFYARAMLEKAQEEAADASYGDAIDFATTANDYAEKAIEGARSAREAGR